MGSTETAERGSQAASPFDLGGSVALVTGFSSGIGAAIAECLAEHGAHVAVNSATSVAAGEQLAEALPGSAYFQGDVGDQA